jgi:rod shape-determining protein MreC
LRVGSVSGVIKHNSGMFQDVTVTPYINFEKLEEVIVILNPRKHAELRSDVSGQ